MIEKLKLLCKLYLVHVMLKRKQMYRTESNIFTHNKIDKLFDT